MIRLLQDTWVANFATNLVEECWEADWSKYSKSRFSSCFFQVLTIVEAASGFFKHSVTTFVPSVDSSILHCWTREILYTSSIANVLKTLELKVPSDDDKSLLKKVSFLFRIRVATDGQWRAIRMVSLALNFDNFRNLWPISHWNLSNKSRVYRRVQNPGLTTK